MKNETKTEGKTLTATESGVTESPKVKLCRLRDIVVYHLHKANSHINLGDLDALENDIKVYIKNFLMTLEEIDATATVTWIGEDNAFPRGY